MVSIVWQYRKCDGFRFRFRFYAQFMNRLKLISFFVRSFSANCKWQSNPHLLSSAIWHSLSIINRRFLFISGSVLVTMISQTMNNYIIGCAVITNSVNDIFDSEHSTSVVMHWSIRSLKFNWSHQTSNH